MHLVDQVASSNRLTHRHPLEKAMLAGGLGGAVLFVPPWPGAVLVLGTVTAAAVGVAGLPVRAWCTVLLWPAGFLIAGGGVTALAVDPTAMVASISPDGLGTAILTSLRALAAVSCLAFFALTTPMSDMGWLLQRVGVPQPILELVLLTYRFTLLLVDTAASGVTAQKARLGWRGPRGGVYAIGLLTATLLPRALERAQRLEIGLTARGFTGTLAVQRDRQPPSPVGVAIAAGTVAVVAAVGALL